MKGRGLTAGQLCGAVGIVIVAVSVYAARDLLRYLHFSSASPVRYEWERSGIAVELTGDRDHAGIYFLPHGATVGDLLREAGIADPSGFGRAALARTLHPGDRVLSDMVQCRVAIGEMPASTRLVLGMPIDLNEATLEDLVLVPGIGHKTAAKIVESRETKGDFSEVEALKRIEGIGEKRYESVRRYLYVKGPSCS